MKNNGGQHHMIWLVLETHTQLTYNDGQHQRMRLVLEAHTIDPLMMISLIGCGWCPRHTHLAHTWDQHHRMWLVHEARTIGTQWRPTPQDVDGARRIHI